MERRGQERDIGMPNSSTYNPSQTSQESPLKLPLAALVSTSNAAVSARRGSAIFIPTQTLDRHLIPPPLHPHPQRHQLNSAPPQQPQLLQKEPTPDPDPVPSDTPITSGPSNSDTQVPPSPPPQAPPPPPPAACTNIRYRECLKNHAARTGGHVVDGCGEFMPSGEEGTAEALRCAACDCHRNFHRKEVEGEHYSSTPAHRLQHHSHKHTHSYSQAFPSGPVQPLSMVNFGCGAAAESSSEDLNTGGGGHAVMGPQFSGSRKRFRTKFSQAQKDRMQEFAEKLGWRTQKEDEEELQRFCREAGVKRQVFKVWMHNNKQAMKRRQI